jgi:hypothetical protein
MHQPYFQFSVLLLVLQPGTFRTLDAGDVGTMDRTHELRIYWVSSLIGRNRVTSQAMIPLKHGDAHACATLPAHTIVCSCQHTPATLVPAGHTVQITPAQGQIRTNACLVLLLFCRPHTTMAKCISLQASTGALALSACLPSIGLW